MVFANPFQIAIPHAMQPGRTHHSITGMSPIQRFDTKPQELHQHPTTILADVEVKTLDAIISASMRSVEM